MSNETKMYLDECEKRGLKPKLTLDFERENPVSKQINTVINAKVNIVNLDEEQKKLDHFVQTLNEARTFLRELASSGNILLQYQITGLDGNAAYIEDTQSTDQETHV